MDKLSAVIDKLVFYARKNLGLAAENEIYARNAVLDVLGSPDYAYTAQKCADSTPEKLLEELFSACEEAGISTEDEREEYADKVMGALTLSPRDINKAFARRMRVNSKAATDWFYTYCVKNDYVKKSKLDKNPRFEEGGLIVTINKAKPEFRDPKKAASGNSVKGGYPKCAICRENEACPVRNKRTLRTVSLTLDGEKWFWQYSPYGYFNQHGIAVNCEHTPMHVDRSTFVKLTDFVDMFPHYFIGCNAPLPRIGGSVLAHDHFQGGGEILPMHMAHSYKLLARGNFDGIAEILDWPGTVIRVVCKDKQKLADVCEEIRAKWIDFRDESLGIIPYDEQGAHNAVSPTVIKTPRGYEMNIILRSNVTSEKCPDGVFHAHPEFHSIKKESIGLIEAQGLFILPGRLEKELSAVEEFIARGEQLPAEYAAFNLVYEEAKAIFERDGGSASSAMKKELGSICGRILENTAVFKNKNLTVKFMEELGFKAL